MNYRVRLLERGRQVNKHVDIHSFGCCCCGVVPGHIQIPNRQSSDICRQNYRARSVIDSNDGPVRTLEDKADVLVRIGWRVLESNKVRLSPP